MFGVQLKFGLPFPIETSSCTRLPAVHTDETESERESSFQLRFVIPEPNPFQGMALA